MDMSLPDAELRARERAVYDRIRERSPQALERSEPIPPREVQRLIGITDMPKRPAGYLRFTPTDFIVEEVGLDNHVATIEPVAPIVMDVGPTLYAELVKIGLGTPEALEQFAHLLSISPRALQYAGLKDGRALTSQHISIRGVLPSDVAKVRHDQLFVKLLSVGKGALAPGQLRGNRFTITVRTEEPVGEAALMAAAQDLQENGFPNVYGAQRFGRRLLNAQLGRLLCLGNYEEALQLFLFEPGPFDVPLFRRIRERARAAWGNWPELNQAFALLPYSFRHERQIIAALHHDPGNWVGALQAIEEQVRFWVYGYAAFLSNQLLSAAYAGTLSIPERLPIPLNGGYGDELFAPYLAADGTQAYAPALARLRFIRRHERTIVSWMLPRVHAVAATSTAAVLSFELSKAAYATSFLAFLFDLYEGGPLPSWVTMDDIDSKKMIGEGSVEGALAQLNYQDLFSESERNKKNTATSSS